METLILLAALEFKLDIVQEIIQSYFIIVDSFHWSFETLTDANLSFPGWSERFQICAGAFDTREMIMATTPLKDEDQHAILESWTLATTPAEI